MYLKALYHDELYYVNVNNIIHLIFELLYFKLFFINVFSHISLYIFFIELFKSPSLQYSYNIYFSPSISIKSYNFIKFYILLILIFLFYIILFLFYCYLIFLRLLPAYFFSEFLSYIKNTSPDIAFPITLPFMNFWFGIHYF